MTSTLRAIAETRFAALVRREENVMNSVHDEHSEVREKTARLRALRLATEAQTIADRTSKLEHKRRAKPAG
ncbi:hypothetical protein [Pelagibacterium montanilacus]|uniref:hypothetical protein n=1 Tax=Pelagibacterium montanilacus TaxID=2185280 RepID=UPI000F8C413D|nr:hypothetical protein [Pelagibacterium montanilacus]